MCRMLFFFKKHTVSSVGKQISLCPVPIPWEEKAYYPSFSFVNMQKSYTLKSIYILDK